MKITKVLEHLSFEGKLQDVRLFSLEKKRQQEGVIAVYKIRRYREHRDRLLTEVQ